MTSNKPRYLNNIHDNYFRVKLLTQKQKCWPKKSCLK